MSPWGSPNTFSWLKAAFLEIFSPYILKRTEQSLQKLLVEISWHLSQLQSNIYYFTGKKTRFLENLLCLFFLCEAKGGELKGFFCRWCVQGGWIWAAFECAGTRTVGESHAQTLGLAAWVEIPTLHPAFIPHCFHSFCISVGANYYPYECCYYINQKQTRP